MAIERIGSWTEIETDGLNTGSASVDVPSDATLMVVGATGYPDLGGASYFTGGAMTIDGAAMSELAGDASNAAYEGAMFYKVSPATGTKTLAWDWEGIGTTAAGNNDTLLGYGFYKGIDTADPVRDTFGGQNAGSPHATDTMTVVSGDMVIAWAFQFKNGATTFAWTNATEVTEFHDDRAGKKVSV